MFIFPSLSHSYLSPNSNHAIPIFIYSLRTIFLFCSLATSVIGSPVGHRSPPSLLRPLTHTVQGVGELDKAVTQELFFWVLFIRSKLETSSLLPA
jgi:hypothetical protein